MSDANVPTGYKQTEVGVIPKVWEVKRLGELATVTSGGTPNRANTEHWNGDIPWITTSELDFHTIDHAEQFITKKGLKNSAAKLLSSGTLLMALYGQGKTRGKVGVLGIEAATNQACAAISLNRDISGNFVFHFLSSQYQVIRNLSNTGNQENLNSSLVRSISVLIPPEPEQDAIAEALGCNRSPAPCFVLHYALRRCRSVPTAGLCTWAVSYSFMSSSSRDTDVYIA